MEYIYSRNNLSRKEMLLQRILEIVPGSISLVTLSGIMILAFIQPVITAAIMIIFLYYWFLRMVYYSLCLLLAFFRLWVESETDWMERIKDICNKASEKKDKKLSLKERLSLFFHYKSKKLLKRSNSTLPLLEELIHLVIIPVYKENREVFEPGIKALSESNYPSGKMIVILALEELSPENIKKEAREVRNLYRPMFKEFFVTIHPADIAGEARVKGANITFAAKRAEKYFNKHNIAFENVIVSCFDADTVVGSSYFACLTYSFLVCPGRTRASFQPVPLYKNNIWRVPLYARILEMGATSFQLIESTNHDLLVSFSSHSMSFKAMADAGYWPVDMISDDSGIYWKSLLNFEGDFQVVPMPMTISMDATESSGFFRTFTELYRQKRRWAWGVENLPLAIRGFMRAKKMRLKDKIKYSFKLFDTYFIWATMPILLMFLGLLPAIFGHFFKIDAVAIFNLGRITVLLFQLSSVMLIITVFITSFFLLKGSNHIPLYRKVLYPMEWIFFPFVTVFLTGFPALDAQIRMMLGKRMEFRATEKVRG